MAYYPRERNPGRRPSDPSEQEIAERCAAIRAGWDARRLREAEQPPPVVVPTVAASDLELNEDSRSL